MGAARDDDFAISLQSDTVTVSATSNEAAIATITVMPRGRNMRPSMPESENKGRNTRMMITVAKTIEVANSVEAR